MSWNKTSVGLNNEFLVATETLTTKSVATNTAGNWSSEIDFIPAGTDFFVVSNTAKTNLSLSVHVELHVAYASGGTYFRDKRTPFIALTGEIDTAILMHHRDVSSKGQFPYYKIKIPGGGGSVTNVIIVGKRRTQVTI